MVGRNRPLYSMSWPSTITSILHTIMIPSQRIQLTSGETMMRSTPVITKCYLTKKLKMKWLQSITVSMEPPTILWSQKQNKLLEVTTQMIQNSHWKVILHMLDTMSIKRMKTIRKAHLNICRLTRALIKEICLCSGKTFGNVLKNLSWLNTAIKPFALSWYSLLVGAIKTTEKQSLIQTSKFTSALSPFSQTQF